ncbi:MAG: glycine--tRNA ligase subunit beta [Nitrospiraceae bacterium]|nr:MAG: glycine--tRNA ligase subunit beta [Nitrospiraceae bacterium]
MTYSSLLLEIGTEEIPARFFPAVLDQSRDNARRLFDEYRITCGDIRSYATPRRMVLMIDTVNPVQTDLTKEVFGPSHKAAFDAQGNPTRAAQGFAESLGVPVSDLKVKKKGKNDYVVAQIEEKGSETKKVLPDILKKLILSLHFPKSMRWGAGTLSFARPIHWILALFDSEIITFELDGIKSSNLTRGHRFLSPASFKIKDPSSFGNLLENNYVHLDPEKRKKIIREGIDNLFHQSDARPLMDEELLDTVNFLVEYPTPVLCSFDREYLELPKELLITVMKDHQKYFAVQDGEGRLANNFIVVSNTTSDNSETIRIGAERVIKARFDDAKFYYHEDLKKSLFSRIDDLKQMTFHDEIGSIYEKVQRLTAMTEYLADAIIPALKDKAVRSALLSKSDLITGVVREFPELQGVMGSYYAQHGGEADEILESFKEQYMPHALGSPLPKTEVGALLSLSDKIDTVASFFSIGHCPTGSEDPFAIRRQAMGIVSILLDRKYPFALRTLFDRALNNLKGLPFNKRTAQNIQNFMEQRIEFIFSSAGFEADLILSVLPLSYDHPLQSIAGRLEAIRNFRKEDIFPDFLLVMKRVFNIIPKKDLPAVNTSLLGQQEEKMLYDTFLSMQDELIHACKKEDYAKGLLTLSLLTTPVNTFFDKVLVMDKQEKIKINRLSLLTDIWTHALLIADFSKLL